MKEILFRYLQHPLTRGMDVDDPRTSQLRRTIIRCKPFLSQIYEEWYQKIRDNVPKGNGVVVELGSGGGFLKEWIPEAITTDVLPITGVDKVLPKNGLLPFLESTVRAIVMTDVLHHIHEPRRFFTEATRVVRPGGAIVMIEPWVTPWSRLVFRCLHPEPFRPESTDWEFPNEGPLSGANGALPWILFHRDRCRFQQEFPDWIIATIEPLMPFVYLLSGGVSMRSFLPGRFYALCRTIERNLRSINEKVAMFAMCKLVRR